MLQPLLFDLRSRVLGTVDAGLSCRRCQIASNHDPVFAPNRGSDAISMTAG